MAMAIAAGMETTVTVTATGRKPARGLPRIATSCSTQSAQRSKSQGEAVSLRALHGSYPHSAGEGFSLERGEELPVDPRHRPESRKDVPEGRKIDPRSHRAFGSIRVRLARLPWVARGSAFRSRRATWWLTDTS